MKRNLRKKTAKKQLNKRKVISSNASPPMDGINPKQKDENHPPTEIRHVEPNVGSAEPSTGLKEGETRVSPSSIHDKIRSWTSIVSCLVTIAGVVIACIQLTNVAKTIGLNQQAERNVEQREIMWATTRMVETFLLSPVLIEGRTAIYDKSYKGENVPSDYTWLDDPTEEMLIEAGKLGNKEVDAALLTEAKESAKLRRAALNNINFLDLLATGVMQGIYNEAIVKDNLEPALKRYVKVFIKGESTDKWNTVKIREFDEEYFPQLMRLYLRWNSLPKTEFQIAK